MKKKNQLQLNFGDVTGNITLPCARESIPVSPVINEPYEYFVLISPDDKVKASIKSVKKMLNEEVEIGQHNLVSIPHITLFKFVSIMNEAFIKDVISVSLRNIRGFPVELNGLHVFSHGNKSRSLVLSIKDPSPIKIIDRRLNCLRDSPRDIIPHVSIARSLPVAEFNKISGLHRFNVEGSFYCDRITVLRKPVHNSFAKYEIYTEIFLN